MPQAFPKERAVRVQLCQATPAAWHASLGTEQNKGKTPTGSLSSGQDNLAASATEWGRKQRERQENKRSQ